MSPTYTPNAESGHLSELASPTLELTTVPLPVVNKISASTSYPGGTSGFQQIQYKNSAQMQSVEPITSNSFASINHIDNVDCSHKAYISDGNISNIAQYQMPANSGNLSKPILQQVSYSN